MDQKKIGTFLKELRREKQLTQEQLAEMLGVTNRSISRWENGINMPDFDVVIELANYYDVSIEEILDGERRKEEMIDKEEERTLLKAVDYANEDKVTFSRRLCALFVVAIFAFIVYGVIEMQGLASTGIYEKIANVSLGFVFGMLLVGALFTSRYGEKVRAFKRKLLRKTV